MNNGWITSTLGKQITLQRGFDITRETMKSGAVPVISSGGINGYHDVSMANGPGVLLGRKGSVGKVHYVESAYWPHDTTLWVKDFHGNWPRFVYHFFSQFPISRYEASTANPSLNRNNLHPVRVFWPPLVEQRRIAEVLDQAEALRAKRGAALAQLDSLTQSLFLDLFGDPVQNPKNWKVVTLDKVAESIADGPFGSNLKLSDYVTDGIPVLQGKNITGNRFQWFDLRFISHAKAGTLERSKVRVGDHLLIKIGSIGYSAIIDDLHGYDCAVIPANLAKISLRRQLIEDAFLHAFLTTERIAARFAAIASKTAQPALSLGKIRAFELPLPPIELQREFARRVTAVEKLKTAHRASLTELDALFATLQHRAFRGEL